jgi:hypothetical protein
VEDSGPDIDELEAEADRLEERSDEVGEHTDQAGSDWETKKHDESGPGAQPSDEERGGASDGADQ